MPFHSTGIFPSIDINIPSPFFLKKNKVEAIPFTQKFAQRVLKPRQSLIYPLQIQNIIDIIAP